MNISGHPFDPGCFGTLRLVLALMLGVPFLFNGLPITSAQGAGLVDDTTYVTGTGQTITWSPPWAFDATRSAQIDETDIVVLTADPAVVALATGSLQPEIWRLGLMRSLGGDTERAIPLEAGIERAVSWWVDVIPLEGVPHGGFSLAYTEPGGSTATITTFLSPIPSFAEDLARAQAAITLDGEAALDGVDGSTLQAQMEATSPELSVTTPAAQNRPSERPRVDRAGTDINRTETPADLAHADAGMVGEGHYISPQFGTEVRWDGTWMLDPFMLPPVISSPAERMDRVDLSWTESDAVMIGVYSIPADGSTMEQTVALWSSDRFLSIYYFPTVEVVHVSSTMDRGAIVLRDDAGLVPYIYYTEFHLVNNGTGFVMVEFISPLPEVPEGLRAAQEHITVNGQPVPTYYSLEEILAEPGM